MHEKIKEIQDYFLAKIIAGEFKVKKVSLYTTMIEIDGFPFIFWTANGLHGFTNAHDYDTLSFIYLPLNEDNKEVVYNSIMGATKIHYAQIHRTERLAELARIKAELNMMEE